MTNRDWGGLRGILDEAKDVSRESKQRPLIDCPICGTVLDVNSWGQRNCPMGHYQTSAATWGEAGLA